MNIQEVAKIVGINPINLKGETKVCANKYLLSWYLKVFLFAEQTEIFSVGFCRRNININFVSLLLYFISLKQVVNLPLQN